MNWIREFYSNLYHANAAWVRVILTCFIFAACVGFVAFFMFPDLLQIIANSFQDRFGADPAMDINLALQIFLQNFIVSLAAIFGGLLLGLGSLLVVLVNGFVIGYVLISIFYLGSDNLFHTLLLLVGGLVPHGVLELPAFLFAAMLGLRLGIEWMQKISVGRRGEVFKKNLIQALTQIPVITLVLFIAALIEVYVSGWVVNNL